MKVNLEKSEAIVLASEAHSGEVYLLTCLMRPTYAICLDEYDDDGHPLFAEFDGTVCHIPPHGQVKKVSFAEVTIKD